MTRQSTPVEWYENYVPPTPIIKPISAELYKVPDLELSFKDDNNLLSNVSIKTFDTAMSRSLMNGKYAASLPVHKIQMKETTEIRKQSGEKKKVTMGSYTCLQVIGNRTNVMTHPKFLFNSKELIHCDERIESQFVDEQEQFQDQFTLESDEEEENEEESN